MSKSSVSQKQKKKQSSNNNKSSKKKQIEPQQQQQQKTETLHQLLRRTIREGVPLYNEGNHKGCYEIYLAAINHALMYIPQPTTSGNQNNNFFNMSIILKEAIKEAKTTTLIEINKHNNNYDEAAWVLRRSIDDVLLEIKRQQQQQRDGKNLLLGSSSLSSSTKSLLAVSATSSTVTVQTSNKNRNDNKSRQRLSSQIIITEEDRDEEWQDEQSINISSDHERAQHLSHIYAILLTSIQLKTNIIRDEDGASYEETCSTSDIIEILVNNFGLSNHRRSSALDVISKLTDIGFLVLVHTSYNTPTKEEKTRFRRRDGLNLYQFPSNDDLEEKYLKLKNNNKNNNNNNQKSQQQGSTDNNVAYLAIGEFLEKFDDIDDDIDDIDDIDIDMPTVSKPLGLLQQFKAQVYSDIHISTSMANNHESNNNNNDDPKLISKGIQLAIAMVQIEPCLKLDDRRHNFTTYQQCFVGSDAVSLLVEKKRRIMKSRESATKLLQKLLQIGFIEHVTKGHNFEDKKLFYYIVSRKKLQDKLLSSDAGINKTTTTSNIGSNNSNNINNDDNMIIIAEHAIKERLKQFPKLSVTEILNSFYGCCCGGIDSEEEDNGKEGNNSSNSNGGSSSSGDGGGGNNIMNTGCWDVVDLQIWRNNMKRWGFGRREDQDDEMVDKLSPLALAVDPDEWKMEEQDPEWSTPWGILAQIAIFDQVPRSAFRGTADAFKWDALAIRATKYAIEKGYFETAYKSTLNRFVLLLPLEHSESWEDQKLGVKLLLQMLSSVAIEDEGLSEYEIVKRLEFSKRLTTAFLEHAQVVAKFKKFPHRNKAHGRPTTIEERVWLASDLVPRWAKSQQHTDEQDHPKKGIIQVPVIPLKRLTRG